jgi:hypothetical protein
VTARFLADTSAIIRMLVGATDSKWVDLGRNGMIAICDPVESSFFAGSVPARSERG